MDLRGKIGEGWSPLGLKEQLGKKIGSRVTGRDSRPCSSPVGHRTLSKSLEKQTLSLEGHDGPRLLASKCQAMCLELGKKILVDSS